MRNLPIAVVAVIAASVLVIGCGSVDVRPATTAWEPPSRAIMKTPGVTITSEDGQWELTEARPSMPPKVAQFVLRESDISTAGFNRLLHGGCWGLIDDARWKSGVYDGRFVVDSLPGTPAEELEGRLLEFHYEERGKWGDSIKAMSLFDVLNFGSHEPGTEVGFSGRRGNLGERYYINAEPCSAGAIRVRIAIPTRSEPLYGYMFFSPVPGNAPGIVQRQWTVEIPRRYIDAASEGRVSLVYQPYDYAYSVNTGSSVQEWSVTRVAWGLWMSDLHWRDW